LFHGSRRASQRDNRRSRFGSQIRIIADTSLTDVDAGRSSVAETRHGAARTCRLQVSSTTTNWSANGGIHDQLQAAAHEFKAAERKLITHLIDTPGHVESSL